MDVFFSDAFFGETYLPVTIYRNAATDRLQRFLWDQREVLREGKLGVAKLINMAKKSDAFDEMVRPRPHLKQLFDGHVRLMVRDLSNVVDRKFTMPYEVVPAPVRSDDEVGRGARPAETGPGLDAEPEPEPESEPEPEHALSLSTAGSGLWRIGYVDSDAINTDMAVGYETLFCYYDEQEKYEASDGDSSAHPMDIEHVLGLRVGCGEFSFAEMGRAGAGKAYSRILGVSGTLTCLSDFERRVIRDYGIENLSQAPSIFGENRMRWNRVNDRRDDFVEITNDKEDFHQAIQNDVSRHQRMPVAVLVFFESDSRLQEYLDYLDRQPFRRNQVFAVKSNVENIEHYVEQAGNCNGSHGNVTLLSRVHGRGLDFKSHSPKVEDNGGIHVVQTFLSEEESEEIQIRGRSARQDKKGTYQLILLRSDLEEKFGVGQEDSVSYEDLDAKRKASTDRKVSQREETVRQAKERHDESMEFADRLRLSPLALEDRQRGMGFLNAPFAQGGPKSVLFLVDYSGSMSNTSIKQSIAAIRGAFDDHIDGDDHVAVTYFSDRHTAGIVHVLDWKKKETHEAEFLQLFERGDRIGEQEPRGGSKLWEALGRSLDTAEASPRQRPPSEYWIVLLLDGDDTDSTGGPHGSSQGWLVGDEREQSKIAHATAMNSHFTQDLLPRVKQLSGQKSLGGAHDSQCLAASARICAINCRVCES